MKASGAATEGWVGRAVPRKEDAPLLTGRGRFIDDLEPVAGMRHAAILRLLSRAGPDGLSAAALSRALFGDDEHLVTVRAEVVPAYGGDTTWANTVAA